MTRELILYTSVGCHLCEEAERIIEQVLPGYPQLTLTHVDIADDAELMDRYGVRIPVVAAGGRELGWPFDETALRRFLDQ